MLGAWAGADRTTGTGRCALSRELGNAGEMTVCEDATAAVTTVYAGGAGEDENRLIQSYGNENGGLARYEAFEDCGSLEDPAMLKLAAERRLSAPGRSMTLEVLDGGLCRYGRDYDVGDVVTGAGGGLADGRAADRHAGDMGEREAHAQGDVRGPAAGGHGADAAGAEKGGKVGG